MTTSGSFPHRDILKTEVVRPMSGLGVLEHNPIGIVDLAGDYGEKVIILELQILFVSRGGPLHGHFTAAGDDLHP